MWKMFLNLAPVVLGGLSTGLNALKGKATSSPGATLGTIFGGLGVGSNPHFTNLVADVLVRLSEYIRALAPAAS